jgi:hypothetical protein
MKTDKFDKLLNDLELKKDFLEYVNQTIDKFEEDKVIKNKTLFSNWEKSVHNVIRDEIGSAINKVGPESLNKFKNLHYSNFLNTTNHKSLFRDIIIENEC